MSDRPIEFEEQNWNDLAEKFINKHRDEWDEFIIEQYEDSIQEPDFDDDWHPEDDQKEVIHD
jgi:hypothetical protein